MNRLLLALWALALCHSPLVSQVSTSRLFEKVDTTGVWHSTPGELPPTTLQYKQFVSEIIDQTNLDSLIASVRGLSGEDSVFVNGSKVKIQNRASNPGGDLAADYLKERLDGYHLEVHEQLFGISGRNIYGVQYGYLYPEKQYILCAHYDAFVEYAADANASGVAAVLEAARILSQYPPGYTIIFALWDETDQGLIGSNYYATQAVLNHDQIEGVVDLDMLGWDGNNDNRSDIHTRNVASSNTMANTAVIVDWLYDLGPEPIIYNPGTSGSDHYSFWYNGFGAIMLSEAIYGGDMNPYYHTAADRVGSFDQDYFHSMSKLALGTIATLAEVTTDTFSIAVTPDSVGFGDGFIGFVAAETLKVRNFGDGPLVVTDIVSDNPVFSAVPPSFTIPPLGRQDVVVTFSPAETLDYSGNLMIASNDTTRPSLGIPLTGHGLFPPAISVTPDSFVVSLAEGDSTSGTLTIGNTGLGALQYDIRLVLNPQGLLPMTAGPEKPAAAPGAEAKKALHRFATEALRGVSRTGRTIVDGRTVETFTEPELTAFTSALGRYRREVDDYLRINGVTLPKIAVVGSSTFAMTSLLLADSSLIEKYDFTAVGDYDLLARIANYDAVIVSEDDYGISLTEAAALQAFYQSGKPVLLGMDDLDDNFIYYPGTKGILTPIFGISDAVDGDFSWGSLNPVNPITYGITQVYPPGADNDWYLPDGSSWIFAGADGHYYGVSNEGPSRSVAMGENLYYFWIYGNGQLIENEIDWIMGSYGWLAVDTSSGTVAPGGSQNVGVRFDAEGVDGGDYYANIVIGNNDPAHDPATVPAHLHVIGKPRIAVSPDTLVFRDAYIGFGRPETLIVANHGSDSLVVTSVASDNPAFTAAPMSFTVPKHSERVVVVTLSPLDTILYAGTLTVTSNDSSHPDVTVAMAGRGIQPPAITVAPDSFVVSLTEGDSTSGTLTIGNTGLGDLSYTIAISGGTFGTGASRPWLKPEVDRPNSTGPMEPSGNTAGPPTISTPLAGVYTGSHLRFGITDVGEVMPFQFPVGTEHLASGTALSGYLVAFKVGLADHVEYTAYAQRSGLVAVSYTELENDPSQLVAEAVIRTAGNELEIVRRFTFLKIDRFIRIETTIKNISGSSVSNITFKEFADWDVDGTTANDWGYDSLRGLVYAHETQYVGIAPHQSPTLIDVNGWNDYNQRSTVLDLPPGVYANIDGLQLLEYQLGGLAAGASAGVVNTFAAGGSLADLQEAVDRSVLRWIEVETLAGTIPPGGHSDIPVRFNATHVDGGDYFAHIVIGNNDPAHDTATVPARLHVTGKPVVGIFPDSLGFGDAYIGFGRAETLIVQNNGSDILVVSSVASDNPAFTAAPSSFSVPKHSEQAVVVTLTPLDTIAYAGTLTVNSNDSSRPVVAIAMSGRGIHPPAITVAPDSFVVSLAEGDSTTRTLTIGNTGLGALNFNIHLTMKPSGSMPMTAGLEGPPGPPGTEARTTLRRFATEALHGVSRTGEAIVDGMPVGAFTEPELTAFTSAVDRYRRDVDAWLRTDGIDLPQIAVVGYSTSDMMYYILADSSLIEKYVFTPVYAYDLPARIDTFDAVIVSEQDYSITLNEAATLQAFSQSGKPVLLGMDDLDDNFTSFPGTKDLLGPIFGISDAHDGDFAWGSLNPLNPITNGITQVYSPGADNDWYDLDGSSWIFAGTDGHYYGVSNDGASRTVVMGENLYYFMRSGNGQLIENAIDWMMRNYRWLSVDSSQGIVPPGGTQNIGVRFNAAGVDGGDYFADIVIGNNDPSHDPATVPARLHVTGKPVIAVVPDSLRFRDAYIGFGRAETLMVRNNGSDSLVVSSVASDNPAFTATPPSFTLPRHTERTVVVTLTPLDTIPYAGTLTFTSNDSSRPVLTVPMAGDGIYPPVITVTPDSFVVSLGEGDTTSVTLTIGNGGLGALAYRVTFESPPGAVPAATEIRKISADEKGLVPPAEGTGVPAYSGVPTSAQPPPAESSDAGTRSLVPAEFLILDHGKDKNPFTGHSYDTVSESRFPTLTLADLENFDVVYFEPGWISYLNLSAAMATMSGYVQRGGIVVINIAGNIGNGVNIDPAGTDYSRIPAHNAETISDPDHPYITGLHYGGALLYETDFDGWHSTDHGYLVNYPAESEVVLSNTDGVSWIHYPYGAGHVIVTTLTYGWGTGGPNSHPMDNLLDYALDLDKSGWLRATPSRGTVAPGASAGLNVRFDARHLVGGDYEASIVIGNNDPGHSPVTIPAYLHVAGKPVLSVWPDSLRFGEVFVGTGRTDTIVVQNPGSVNLLVTGIASDNGAFAANPPSFTVPPNGQQTVRVTFTPADTLAYLGTLTISSNDTSRPEFDVPVRGTGVYPPVMSVLPDTFAISARRGSLINRAVTIANAGAGPLHVVVRKGSGGGWLSVATESLDVPSGQSLDKAFTVSTTGLAEGTYVGEILVSGNDPLAPQAHVPVILSAYENGIAFTPDTVRFGEVAVGYSDTAHLTMRNVRLETLTVTELAVANPDYKIVDSLAFALTPGAQRVVRIAYTPDGPGPSPGLLEVHTDHPLDTMMSVELSGTGVLPSALAVSPESLVVVMYQGLIGNGAFTIYNHGTGPLSLAITPEGTTSASRQQIFELTALDAAGNSTVRDLGIHPDATRCVDAGLGEAGMPPIPPEGAFDFRFVDPGPGAGCFDQGLYSDFRPYVWPAQVDTFALLFQTGPGGYPFTFSWPAGLGAHARELRLVDPFGGVLVNTDMTAAASLIVSDPLIDELLIVRSGVVSGDSCTRAVPDQGVVAPGDSLVVALEFGTCGRVPGEYAMYVTIESNDPVNPSVLVPVHLTVLTGVDEAGGTVPQAFRLYQNYPNPFNPVTTIDYDLAAAGQVTLDVYDILGHRVAGLVDEHQAPGRRSASFDAGRLPSGIYTVRLTAGTFSDVKKMLLLK